MIVSSPDAVVNRTSAPWMSFVFASARIAASSAITSPRPTVSGGSAVSEASQSRLSSAFSSFALLRSGVVNLPALSGTCALIASSTLRRSASSTVCLRARNVPSASTGGGVSAASLSSSASAALSPFAIRSRTGATSLLGPAGSANAEPQASNNKATNATRTIESVPKLRSRRKLGNQRRAAMSDSLLDAIGSEPRARIEKFDESEADRARAGGVIESARPGEVEVVVMLDLCAGADLVRHFLARILEVDRHDRPQRRRVGHLREQAAARDVAGDRDRVPVELAAAHDQEPLLEDRQGRHRAAVLEDVREVQTALHRIMIGPCAQ